MTPALDWTSTLGAATGASLAADDYDRAAERKAECGDRAGAKAARVIARRLRASADRLEKQARTEQTRRHP